MAAVNDKAVVEDALNDLNKDYYSRVSSRNDIALTQTKMNGTFCIRFAIGAARTQKAHVEALIGTSDRLLATYLCGVLVSTYPLPALGDRPPDHL